MGKMDKVARGADTAALRDIGRHSGVDHIAHQFEEHKANAGIALGQGVQADGQDAEGDRGANGVSQTCGMADNEIFLQRLNIPVVDNLIAHRAIGGVDAIDDLFVPHRFFQKGSGGLAAGEGVLVKGDIFLAHTDCNYVSKGQIVAGKAYDWFCAHLL
ncbi:MAG: hypothetical protein ACD_75C01954G0003 [uncultured bacterium]|nr:MAG: hypothetical protein ACD_75C01954G0003 [uncultured bacterium]